MNLSNYLVSKTGEVIVVGVETESIWHFKSFDAEIMGKFVVGREFSAFLITYSEFLKLKPHDLLFMLSRIRGDGVEVTKSKIGILYDLNGEGWIDWM